MSPSGPEPANGRDSGLWRSSTVNFWPFSRKSAFVASLILVPICFAALIWLADEDIAGFEVSIWAVVVTTLLGLLPVVLVVLGGVGSVEAAGVKIAFAAVQEVVDTASHIDTRGLLAGNLGQAPGQVQDSGSDTVIQTLDNAVGIDVVEISLKEGDAWWETRLLLLAVGASRLGRPRAVAFTQATQGGARTFIGWASPVDIERRLLATHGAFREAYERAMRDCLLHRLSVQNSPSDPRRLPWARAGKATVHVAEGTKKPALGVRRDDDTWEMPWPSPDAATAPWVQELNFLPERLLLQQIEILEAPGADWRITESRLRDLLGSVLFTDAVDRDDSEESWIATIVGSTAEYFAVTSGGQLITLVPRSSALNAVLLTLLRGRGRAD